MRTQISLALGTLALVLAVTSTAAGCVFGVEPTVTDAEDASQPSDVADTDTGVADGTDTTDAGETGSDAGDTGDATDGGDTAECSSDDDCANPEKHTTATCNVDRECVDLECAEGWVDTNDDVEDGCECMEENYKTRWLDCDGDDFAGNEAESRKFCGEPDEKPARSLCESEDTSREWSNRKWTLTEPAGDDTVDCNDAAPGARPDLQEDGLDERWRCDGLDNDCDGTEDGPCCLATGGELEAKTVTSVDSDQSAYALVPAHGGAPDGAAFNLIWAEGDTLYTQHLGPRGDKVGDSDSESLDYEVQNLAGADTTNGYEYLVSTEAQGVSGAVDSETRVVFGSILPGDPEIETPTRLASNSGSVGAPAGRFVATSIGSIEDTSQVFAAWGDEEGDVVGYTYSLASPSSGTRFDLSEDSTEGQVTQNGRPVVSSDPDRGFAVAWWNAGAAEVLGQLFNTDGTANSRFSFSISRDSGSESLRIELAPYLGGRWLVLHPNYQGGGANLRATPIDSDGSPQGDQAVTLLDSGNNLAPDAHTVDLGEDDTLDRLVVAWQEGTQSTQPPIRTSWAPLDDLTAFGAETGTLKDNGRLDGPATALGADSAGVVWHDLTNANSRNVDFFPLSLDGPPICPVN